MTTNVCHYPEIIAKLSYSSSFSYSFVLPKISALKSLKHIFSLILTLTKKVHLLLSLTYPSETNHSRYSEKFCTKFIINTSDLKTEYLGWRDGSAING